MKVEKVIHKGETRIKVDLPYSAEKIALIRQIEGATWSRTLHSWHIPYSKPSYKKLTSLFSDIELPSTHFLKKEKTSTLTKDPTNSKDTIATNPIKAVRGSVEIYQLGRKILVKMPKNDADIKFLLSLRYSRWNKTGFCWEIPNYPGNLELLTDYFNNRISVMSVAEKIEMVKSERTIGVNEVLCIRTQSGRIKILGVYNKELARVLKKMPYCVWDPLNKWWTVPYTEKFLETIKSTIEKQNFTFLYEEELVDDQSKVKRLHPCDVANYRSCPAEYLYKLTELRYSPTTLRSYKSCFEEFINFYPRYDIDKIDEPMIISFIRYLVTDRKVSVSYQNICINAIKFYYERVLGGQRKIYRVERPIKEKTLPVVLSEEEVIQLFKQVSNIKHKTILMLTYSAGLRIGEVIRLKPTDIDSKRMQVRIEQSKGKKDRYTLLSKKMVVLLRQYYKEYRPQQWLFEGTDGQQYSDSSIQSILKQAVVKARINKKITVHTLRHSFATHLLERGTDLRYIQSILGHESSKTTEVYTHITTKGIDQIQNPLDELDIE